MDRFIRFIAAALCLSFIFGVGAAAEDPGDVISPTPDETDPDAVVFCVEDTDVGLGERITFTIKAKNVPENGMSAALIGLRFDKSLKFVRADTKINAKLKGNKSVGTKDIDRGDMYERRLMWVDDNGGVTGDFVFATAVFTLPDGVEAGTVFEFGLALSDDPKNYLDGNALPIPVRTESFTVTVRDYESPLSLTVGEASFDGADAIVPVTLSNVASVRGGLKDACFDLAWTGGAALSSVEASAGEAVALANADGVASIGWSSDEPVKADLTFNCRFDLSECGCVYNTDVTPAIPDGASFTSAEDVNEAERVGVVPGSVAYEAHSVELVAATEPKCDTPGNVAYYKCKVCGRLFSYADVKREVFENDVVIDGPGHAWGDWTVSTPADCVTAGEERCVCANDPTHVDTRPIEPLGHILDHFDAVAPTVEANGNIEYWKCSRCGKYYTDAEARFETEAEGVIAVFEPGKGDVNGDGAVNGRDVALLLRYLTGWTNEDYPALAAFRSDLADLNDDGKLTPRDAFLLAKSAAGLAVHNAEAIVEARGASASARVLADDAGGDPEGAPAGDINGDGRVNAKDVVALMKALVRDDPADNMDTNGDGRINAKDVIALMKLILKKSTPRGPLDTGVTIDGYPQEYNDFLSGALFCGDSICDTLERYGFLPEDNVVAAIGAGVFTIRSEEQFTFDVDGESYQFDEAVKLLSPKRVVLWLGINDSGYDLQRFSSGYRALIDAIKEDAPQAQIYVMSIAPIGKDTTLEEKYGVTNETVDKLNGAIAMICAGYEIPFVDISAILKGEDNCLSDEFAAHDGIHLPYNAFPVVLRTFLDTILGYTIEGDPGGME